MIVRIDTTLCSLFHNWSLQRSQTALHLAAMNGNIDATRALLDKGANHTLKDEVSIYSINMSPALSFLTMSVHNMVHIAQMDT